MTMELMGGEIKQPEDEKRQRLLANLAKAREARKLKAETRTDPVEPKPRKKKAKKKGKREFNAVSAPKKSSTVDWAGLSPTVCAIGCEPDCCLITGENVCGHPGKGGLQGKYMQDKQALRRFGEARQYLAHIEAEGKKKF